MNAKDNFIESIKEVLFLNNQAAEDDKNSNIYFKSVILLLCAKLEKYVKDSAEEYIKKLLEKRVTNDKIPKKLICELIKNEVDFFNKLNNKNDYILKPNYIKRAKIFSIIWENRSILNIYDENFGISISNNGTTELKAVYKKIGMDDIFDNFPDYKNDNLYSATLYPVLDEIDSVICMRHNIIHNDANPSITMTDINISVEIFKFFVLKTDEKLNESLSSIN